MTGTTLNRSNRRNFRIAPNVKFEIDDIESEWNYSKKFDFIMGRYLMNGLKNYKWVIEQAFKSVSPPIQIQFYLCEITAWFALVLIVT